MKKSTESIRNALALVAAANAASNAQLEAHDRAFGGKPFSGIPHPGAEHYEAAAAAVREAYAAVTTADEASAAAAEAVGALPWGAHGAYFVTRRSSIARMDRQVVLHRNGRPLVAVYSEDTGAPFRFAMLPHGPTRQKIGAAAHAAVKRQADELRTALRALPVEVQDKIASAYYGDDEGDVPLGGGWYYCPGQEGGFVALLPVWVPNRTEAEWGLRPTGALFAGAGRAVREVILPGARERLQERTARENAALAAEAAVAQARALRVSFGDRSTL